MGGARPAPLAQPPQLSDPAAARPIALGDPGFVMALALSPQRTAILGMIHALPLPGTPRWGGSMAAVLDRAIAEAQLYRQAGLDAIIVENMHDTPYLKGGVGPEITAAMTRVAAAVRAESGLPTGVQILAGANREALGVALAAGLEFVRVEGFVFAHVADEGIIQSCAGDLLRYRRMIGAEGVQVFADIKKKHSAHVITADVDLAETAKAAAFFGADGVIVTGTATGAETDPTEVSAVRRAVELPVLVGSGVTVDNLDRFVGTAHGLIVGSHFKVDGRWDRGVDPQRLAVFMNRVAQLRAGQP